MECGYCAYAHFTFRLSAAVETDFTLVTNEVRPGGEGRKDVVFSHVW